MSQEIAKFWRWFNVYNKQLVGLNAPDVDEDEKDHLLDAMLETLHQYSDKLYFDIGGAYGEQQELVITAEGNVDYFEKAEELINDAPEMTGWKFTALMPPRI